LEIRIEWTEWFGIWLFWRLSPHLLKEGAKDKAQEMAKAMKEKGEPLEKISKFIELSKEEIEKL